MSSFTDLPAKLVLFYFYDSQNLVITSHYFLIDSEHAIACHCHCDNLKPFAADENKCKWPHLPLLTIIFYFSVRSCA